MFSSSFISSGAWWGSFISYQDALDALFAELDNTVALSRMAMKAAEIRSSVILPEMWEEAKMKWNDRKEKGKSICLSAYPLISIFQTLSPFGAEAFFFRFSPARTRTNTLTRQRRMSHLHGPSVKEEVCSAELFPRVS